MIAELERITVRRGGRAVLRELSLAVEAGTLTVTVGADGAGRTTLLQVLAGARRPDAGHTHLPAPADVGYVSEGSGVYPDLTVEENLRFSAAAYGLRGRQRDGRIDDLLSITQLEGARTRLAGQLSGGMRQKLAFACATLHEPGLLVLDEPTTGVDPISRAELWRLVSTQITRGAAAVVATGYPDEAERAHQAMVLENGRLRPTDTTGHGTPIAPSAACNDDATAVGTTLLRLDGLEVRFGHVQAVAQLSLSIAAGEVVGLLGANGAGKTTAIRTALGLQDPSAGHVALFGEPPSRRGRRDVGYVPQSLGLWQDLTPRQNLAFLAAAYGSHVPALPDALAAHGDHPIASLSLGHRRRLAFEAALGHEPQLLVLDEPTSGVGEDDRNLLWDRIHAARDAGAGALVTTHHMSEAQHCDRIVVLMAGRVVASGTLCSLLEGRETVVVRTPRWSEAFTRLDARFAAVALAGREVRVPDAEPGQVEAAIADIEAQVTTAAASLDEVFVALGRAA